MDAPERARSRTIVVYGRPRTPRNAFPAIVDGLRAWRRADPRAIDWQTVSVGQSHPDIDLGVGDPLRSIGKLDLDGYASLLRESAIGISLMVSPHPSYPPLEMAHLGLLVLTNGFANKDLSRWHSNIVSTDDISAAALAARLSELCAGSKRTRTSVRRGDRSRRRSSRRSRPSRSHATSPRPSGQGSIGRLT